MFIVEYLENKEKYEKENQSHCLHVTSVNLLWFGIAFLFLFFFSYALRFLRKLEKTLYSVNDPLCTLSISLLLINIPKRF